MTIINKCDRVVDDIISDIITAEMCAVFSRVLRIDQVAFHKRAFYAAVTMRAMND